MGNSATVLIVVSFNRDCLQITRGHPRFLIMNLPMGCLERLQHNTPLGLDHYRGIVPLLDMPGPATGFFASGDDCLIPVAGARDADVCVRGGT